MDRNNFLVRKTVSGIFYGFLLSMLGACQGQVPTKESIVGEWKSQYEEVFILNKDSTFEVKNLRSEVFFYTTPNERINGNGHWSIKKENGRWILNLRYLSYKNDKENNYKQKIVNDIFYILGSGLRGNKSPWLINSWDEETDFSRFKKVK